MLVNVIKLDFFAGTCKKCHLNNIHYYKLKCSLKWKKKKKKMHLMQLK